MAVSRASLPPLLRWLTSLQLTIACLAIGMFIIFFGTWEQQRLGVEGAVEVYFRSFLVWWSPPGASWRIPIMPGGFLVGSVLLLNLVASHIYRFRLTWSKLGIWLVHLGLIVLLLGELFTAVFARESYMRLNEGQTKAYSEARRETELAIIDRSDPQTDRVVAIAESGLKPGASYQLPSLPFRVIVHEFYPNSRLFRRTGSEATTATPPVTQGFGTQILAVEAPRTGKLDERDTSVAWIELVGTGGSLGTWMTSTLFGEPQEITYQGKPYTLELRPRRYYKPFQLTLRDFTHDVYPGTDIPKNFASRVHLVDPARHEDREVLIYMNHPLRHAGLTFYQSGFDGEQTTILQVVRNPSRQLPYISCLLVGFGLALQFWMHLSGFLRRRKVLTSAANGGAAAHAS